MNRLSIFGMKEKKVFPRKGWPKTNLQRFYCTKASKNSAQGAALEDDLLGPSKRVSAQDHNDASREFLC